MQKLFKNLKKFNNKIALIDSDGTEYSYNELLKKTEFINSKIEGGSLILILASNTVESIIGYVAFIRSKNTSILLDKSFKTSYVEKITKVYKPNYIFCPKNYFNNIKENYVILSFQDYVLVRTNYNKHKKINKKNLLLLSTSGTTQNPKFVRLSNLNLYYNTNNIIKYLKINFKHTTITTMPMAYSYGLSIINTHLLSGSKIVVNNKTIFEREFWTKLHKYKITSFGGVPEFYEQLKKLKFEKFHLPDLKYVTQAGGKIEKGLLKYFGNICKEKKIKFITMYGQTEASPRMSYLGWNNFFTKLGSIGKALDGSYFKILKKNGEYTNKPFVNGELIFFGKNVSLGYSNSLSDLYKDDINNGKLFTGDLAYKDVNGYFYITGRKNRISKIFGIRFNLDDIQSQLKKNNYKVKCIADNKYLRILIVDDYNVEKMKKIIQNLYGINKNFIIISRVKKFTNQNNFKSVINPNK